MTKKSTIIHFSFLNISILLCSYFMCAAKVQAEDKKYAIEVMEKVKETLAMIDTKSEQLITIHRGNGSQRKYKLNLITNGKDKAFFEIVEPSRVKGIQMLRLGELIWQFKPNIKKSLRVSGRQSFMGSDVREIEFLRFNLLDDYIIEWIVENMFDEYVINLITVKKRSVYPEIRLWVDKKKLQPVKQVYFSHSGKIGKTKFYHDYKNFNGIMKPSVIEIKSILFPERTTTLTIVSCKKNVQKKWNIFHKSNLGRHVSKI